MVKMTSGANIQGHACIPIKRYERNRCRWSYTGLPASQSTATAYMLWYTKLEVSWPNHNGLAVNALPAGTTHNFPGGREAYKTHLITSVAAGEILFCGDTKACLFLAILRVNQESLLQQASPSSPRHGDSKAAQDTNCLHLRHPQLQHQTSGRRCFDPCRRPYQQGKHLRGRLSLVSIFGGCLVDFATPTPLTSRCWATAQLTVFEIVKLSRAVKWLEEADFEAKIIVGGKC